MNTPYSRSYRSLLAISGCAFAALTLPAFAADAPAGPAPDVSISSFKQGPVVIVAGDKPDSSKGASSNNNNNNNNNAPRGGQTGSVSTTRTVSTKNTSRYIIRVHNASKFTATGVEVEYTIYNKTVTTNNGIQDQPQLVQIHEVLPVDDIPPGKDVEVKTDLVPHEVTQTNSPGNRGGKATSTAKNVSVLGYRAQLHFNGKNVGRLITSDNLDNLLKPYDLGR